MHYEAVAASAIHGVDIPHIRIFHLLFHTKLITLIKGEI